VGNEAVKIGLRGTIVIPADLRKQYGLNEGTLVLAEPVAEGILLRPVAMVSVELYSKERKAEFLLNTAVTEEDYRWAVREVEKLGLDPASVPHEKP